MTITKPQAVAVAPEAAAAQFGADVLSRKGNAIEAALAMAAILSVTYPHMTGIGGDAFWLIVNSDGSVTGIDGSGPAGSQYTADLYRRMGVQEIPTRGTGVLNTVPGAVSVWALAYRHSRQKWHGTFDWGDLIEPAVRQAAEGFRVSPGLDDALRRNPSLLSRISGFFPLFPEQRSGQTARIMRAPALAASLRSLQKHGAETFYRGELSEKIIRGLSTHGSRLKRSDLENYNARFVTPLQAQYKGGSLVNMPPPSQGIASLLILEIVSRVFKDRPDHLDASYIHTIVEATKLAFTLRDSFVGDPDFVSVPIDRWLSRPYLDLLADMVDLNRAAEFPVRSLPGDTVWYGAVDSMGRAVSAIQSIFYEFGSGVVVGDTGILWQNRGCAFSLEPGHPNCLQPKKRPLHTLSPALYLKPGGPYLIYGTMGGNGQPQTQAALVTRVLDCGMSVAEAVSAPRWLFGSPGWSREPSRLWLERRFSEQTFEMLRRLDHQVEWTDAYSRLAGHAGMIRFLGAQSPEAAADPRSDGAACWA